MARRAQERPNSIPLECSLSIEASSGDAEARTKNFSGVAYTGAAISPYGWESVVIAMDGISFAKQIPVFLRHNRDKIVGYCDSIVAGSSLEVSGQISLWSEAGAEVFELAKDGFRWQMSIGAVPDDMLYVEAKKSVEVNGKLFQGPITVVRKCTLKEVSFVPLGADSKTSAKVSASHCNQEQVMADEIEQGEEIADVSARDDDIEASLRAKAAGELERQAGIMECCGQFPKLAAQAIRENWSIEATKREAAREKELADLRASRATGPSGSVSAIGSDTRTIEAALSLCAGLGNIDSHYDAKTLDAADKVRRSGFGLQSLLLMCAAASGYIAQRVNSGNVRSVLRAAFSYADIDGILSNTANKFLAQAFMAVENAWQSIASVSPVSDFKQVTRYRLTGTMSYEKLGPSGSIKHGSTGELSYTNKADTYARMMAISREDIINDDLGALAAVPRMLGRGAALKINNVFWTEFLANSSFFTSGHSNLVEGTAYALSAAGLKKALETFRKQTDADSNPLGVRPKVLLVPPELETTADELMTSTQVNTGGSSSSDRVPNRNTWAGKFTPVTSAYLSDTAYTGYSSTAWYLLADPMDLPVIEIVFLDGRDMPTIESSDVDFDQLGIQMRGYHDFGVNLQEYRGGVKVTGVAAA